MYLLYIPHYSKPCGSTLYIPHSARHSAPYRLYYAYFAIMSHWTNYAVHTVSHITACQPCTIIYHDTHSVLYRMGFVYAAARYIIYILYYTLH